MGARKKQGYDHFLSGKVSIGKYDAGPVAGFVPGTVPAGPNRAQRRSMRKAHNIKQTPQGSNRPYRKAED